MRKILARGLVVAALLSLFAAVSPATGHGPADWIQGLRNGVNQLCCGERDCGEWSGLEVDGSIVGKADGYHVHATFRGAVTNPVNGTMVSEPFALRVDQVVPYSKALPSPDGRYWACIWGQPKELKCFFAPPPGT